MTTEIDRQMDILTARAVDVVSKEEFRQKIEESVRGGKPLRVKYGADPSAPDIHLGHVVGLNKLREFQDLGHTVVFIIGDFTGMIGDPSGRSDTRQAVPRDEILDNARTYQEQVFRILDRDRTEVRFNSEWCSSVSLEELFKLAANVTVAQMLSRDDFNARFKERRPISLVEFLYPLLQGYDSVMIDADVEVGGTDQIFNLLVGRDIQRAFGRKQQVALTLPLLEGLDGARKMSKSFGNYIGVEDSPHDMFGKLMSLDDSLMWRYYSLVLRKPDALIQGLRRDVERGTQHPRAVKDELAVEVTTMFHGAAKARAASREFARVFSERKTPEDMPTVVIPESRRKHGKLWIVSLLVSAGLAESNGAARRLIRQGAVRVDEEPVSDIDAELEIPDGAVLRAGKRGFVRVVS